MTPQIPQQATIREVECPTCHGDLGWWSMAAGDGIPDWEECDGPCDGNGWIEVFEPVTR